MCADVVDPPTRRFKRGDRYPDVIYIGCPMISPSGSKMRATKHSIFLAYSRGGLLSTLYLSAVAERVNSDNVKCLITIALKGPAIPAATNSPGKLGWSAAYNHHVI